MSFGSGFSFGNTNNNNNQSSGFGGFGNNNTSTNTGFGASTTNNTFGSSTTGNNPFGGGSSTFGSNTGGFGASNTGSSLFGGNKPASSSPFGATNTGTGSIFGANNNNATTNTGGFGGGGFGTSTNTGGGFGAANNNTTTTTTGGGFSFGNSTNKPAFGSSTATTTPLFGQGGAGTTGGFGNTGAFGSPGTGTALNQPVGPSDGTASTPFAATSEKEPNGVTNSYQSITFQQPYQKYSFEELRLADYNAGRQFGNGSGQPGAFGSNAFGGFSNNNNNNNNTGGFGSNNTNTTTNPFGGASTSTTFGNNTTTTGFGGGAGLFGNNANKPGGLFGNQTTTSSTSGGLFGTANSNNTSNLSGSTLFGGSSNSNPFGNNNQNQNKPSGGLFGNNTATSGNAFSFGQNNNNNNNNAAGGLFGANNNTTANTTATGGGLFGNTNQQQNNSGGLFGNRPQANSLFNNNKTGSAFGTATTQGQTGGLFGNTNNNTAATGGGLFGNTNTNNNNNQSGGLFGNNQNTSGGLFGNNNNANQSGQKSLFGGGFGNTNTGSNTGGGLFANTNTANNQNSGSLFSNTNNNAGGFSFGNNAANKPNTSLFGGTSNNPQNTGIFGSNSTNPLFNNSQNQQQNNQQQQDAVKHASLLDPNPYGQSSIWTGLPPPTPENAKPVFTPLTATQKMKESMMKPPPPLRLNQSRYMTPPRRNGFGFSYSTYGTPSSAASTPGGAGLSGSMYGSRGFSGGSFGRSFNKSASVQNLRSQFASDSDDIWKPGAFTSTHRNSSGSIKRLTIDRTIRNDLFSRPSLPALPSSETNTANINGTSSSPQINNEVHTDTGNKLKKRVSFENGLSGGVQTGQLDGETGALVRTETDDDHHDAVNGQVNGSTSDSQSRGKDLAAVPEDRESDHVSSRPTTEVQAKADPKPGDYWMKPSRAEMSKLSRDKLQRFKDFQVGRQGCGQVTFNGTVDLTALPLDELYDKIVEIRLRSVTVYPDASSKPPVGKGLNVPSTIQIENSWPRSRNQPSSATSGPVFDKHVQRLKKMAGTEFVKYEPSTGIWTFRVPHYTRYGLDYDDDDEMSELTVPPESIEKSAMDVDVDEYENDEDEDDTFAFKQKMVPGGFGRQFIVGDEPNDSPAVQRVDQDEDGSEQSAFSEEEMSEDEPSMVGSYPVPGGLNFESPNKPILKAGRLGTPGKPLLDLEGDWAEQLQRTISPRKQNRDMLRETQNKATLNAVYSPIKPRTIERKDFRTSIDVMNSIFGQNEEQRVSSKKQAKAQEADFEFPYAKRAKTFDSNLDDMSEADQKWHQSFKTQFTGLGDFIYRIRNPSVPSAAQQGHVERELVGDNDDVVMKSSLRPELSPFDMKAAMSSSKVTISDDVPFVEHQSTPFSQLSGQLTASSSISSSTESDVYELLHILFDDFDDEFTHDLSASMKVHFQPQIRKDRLTKFLSTYVHRKYVNRVAELEKENPTAAAILKLTAKDIKGACNSLAKIKDYKLMVLVSQLADADETFQDRVKAQIDAWREQRVLSEMTVDVRSMYELCAGNTTISAGTAGNNVPVEDKANTFSIGDEYDLDWIQSFALGLWFGREEKRLPSATGVVSVESAVLEFHRRCERREETQLPGNDPLWAVLRIFAAVHGVEEVEMPVLPGALEKLNDTWNASKAFNLHYAIISNIQGVTIDEDAEEELIGLLAYQLGSKGDMASAAYVLMHLDNANKRKTMLKELLEHFAGQLPDPPSSVTSSDASNATPTAAKESSTTNPIADLWAILTNQLQIPASWLYQSKALHARAVTNNPTKELEYLIAARSWPTAHECFTHRVAPALVIDEDMETLTATVDLFDDDVLEKVPQWESGGGVYGDFALMCTAKGPLNQGAVEDLRKRLVEMGRKFNHDDNKKVVDLGKLPVEELEQRVAVQEMSRVVALKYVGSRKAILELPLTSDQRIVQTAAMAVEYYQGCVGMNSAVATTS